MPCPILRSAQDDSRPRRGLRDSPDSKSGSGDCECGGFEVRMQRVRARVAPYGVATPTSAHRPVGARSVSHPGGCNATRRVCRADSGPVRLQRQHPGGHAAAPGAGPGGGTAALPGRQAPVSRWNTEPGHGHQRPGLGSGLVHCCRTGTRRAALWKDRRSSPTPHARRTEQHRSLAGLNDEGAVVGISQTDDSDPLHEDWSCELGGFLTEATDLHLPRVRLAERRDAGAAHARRQPQLRHRRQQRGRDRRVGGDGSARSHLRRRPGPPVPRRHLGPEERQQRQDQDARAPPFPGDSASAATAINDEGQVVGISGRCDQAVGRFSALHAVLWDKNGKPTEIPNLGGTTWHTPMDINGAG